MAFGWGGGGVICGIVLIEKIIQLDFKVSKGFPGLRKGEFPLQKKR